MCSQVRHNFVTEKNIQHATAGDKDHGVSVELPVKIGAYHNHKNYDIVGKDQFRDTR